MAIQKERSYRGKISDFAEWVILCRRTIPLSERSERHTRAHMAHAQGTHHWVPSKGPNRLFQKQNMKETQQICTMMKVRPKYVARPARTFQKESASNTIRTHKICTRMKERPKYVARPARTFLKRKYAPNMVHRQQIRCGAWSTHVLQMEILFTGFK